MSRSYTVAEVESAEDKSSALDELLYHLKEAKEHLQGSGCNMEGDVVLIDDMIVRAEAEMADYDAILAIAQSDEDAAMNLEYERSVL